MRQKHEKNIDGAQTAYDTINKTQQTVTSSIRTKMRPIYVRMKEFS